MNATLTKVTGDEQGVLLQHQYLNNDVDMLKNGDGNPRPGPQFTFWKTD